MAHKLSNDIINVAESLTRYGKAASEFMNDWRVEIEGDGLAIYYTVFQYDLIDYDLDFNEEYYSSTIIPNVEDVTLKYLKNILKNHNCINRICLRITMKLMHDVYVLNKSISLSKDENGIKNKIIYMETV